MSPGHHDGPGRFTRWTDIAGVAVQLPRLPVWLWWITLPVQALSGPTTAESRQVVILIGCRDGSSRELHLRRPPSAPYSREAADALDALLGAASTVRSWQLLADRPVATTAMEAVTAAVRLSRPGAAARAEQAACAALSPTCPVATTGLEHRATRVGYRDWPGAPAGYRNFERTVQVGQGDRAWEEVSDALMQWQVKTRSGFTVDVPAGQDVRAAAGQDRALVVRPRLLRLREPVRVVAAVEADGWCGRLRHAAWPSGQRRGGVHRAPHGRRLRLPDASVDHPARQGCVAAGVPRGPCRPAGVSRALLPGAAMTTLGGSRTHRGRVLPSWSPT